MIHCIGYDQKDVSNVYDKIAKIRTKLFSKRRLFHISKEMDHTMSNVVIVHRVINCTQGNQIKLMKRPKRPRKCQFTE